MVRERNDLRAVEKIHEHDVVRERVNRHLPNVFVAHTRYAPADLRKRFDELERPPRFSDKAARHPYVALPIPCRCFFELGFRRFG